MVFMKVKILLYVKQVCHIKSNKKDGSGKAYPYKLRRDEEIDFLTYKQPENI